MHHRPTRRTGWTRWLGMALGLCCAARAAAATQPLLDCLPDATPKWARPAPGTRSSAVVFLHGLHGDGRETWIASGKAAWPCLVLEDREVFGDSGVYLTSYHTMPGVANPTTTEAARRVALDLKTAGVFNHLRVTVVAHSMGGIVLARMLTTPGILSDEQRRRVRLVLFVGTPALPTEAAALCSKFGINEQCTEMSDADAMQKLWTAWDRLPQRPAAWCSAEGATTWLPRPRLEWPYQSIVPVDSAHRPCLVPEYRSIAHDLNHTAVAKPISRYVEPHGTLRRAFAACLRPEMRSDGAAAGNTSAQAAAVSRWVYDLKDQLERERSDWTLPLRQVLSPEVNRFWYPASNQPSFDLNQLDRLGASAFMQALRQTLPELLSSVEFDWVETVDRVQERIADGAMEGLALRMHDQGGLASTDMFAAVRFRQREVEGQWLLVLRPTPALPGGYALLGVLSVPRPAGSCRT